VQLEWLRTLVAVVETGSFTRAAVELGLSQPTVSQQMAALEREAALPLFEPLGRRRVPTEAAIVLVERARVALASVEDAGRTLEELRGLGRGSLRVGASTTPGVYMVPKWLGEFASRYPGVEVHLDIADTRDVEDRLIKRRVDVAIVGEYDSGPELVATTLGSDVLFPICAPGQADMRTLDSFLEQRFIAREKGSSTRETFERWLRERGLRLRPAMEVTSTEAVKQVVAAGLGVSVVSGATIQLELKARLLASPPTDGFPINRRIDVVLQRNRRPMPTTVAFLEILLGPRGTASLAQAAAALASREKHESG
jgi:DNA-binding transcriptional LysR family regulator